MNTIARTVEAGEAATGIGHEVLADFDGLSVIRATSRALSLEPRNDTIEAGCHQLTITFRGTRVTQSYSGRFDAIVPPRSLVYGRGPVRMTYFMGRGDHESLVLTWHGDQARALDRWTRSATDDWSLRGEGGWAIRPIPTAHHMLPERLVALCASGNRSREVLLYAAVHDLLAEMLTSSPRLQLNSHPREQCQQIEGLVAAVERAPHHPWTLELAAEIADYSSFHLSRTFRAIYGYGFPEYVDRCRTEMAVRLLIEDLEPVDDVADRCGFGSGQALRAAVKEHLGILPSELRRLAHLIAPLPQAGSEPGRPLS